MIEGVTKHVYDAFLVRLLAAFGEPASPEPERFLAEYSRMLRNYASSELSRAADHLLATHKGPQRWPRIADCIDAAESAREAAQHRARADNRDDAGDWSQRAAAAERAMADSPMGIASCHEGWANGLREFLMQHRRFPHSHEVHELKRNAEFIDRCAAGTINLGIMHAGLVELAGKMIDRRHAIADRVMGGANG